MADDVKPGTESAWLTSDERAAWLDVQLTQLAGRQVPEDLAVQGSPTGAFAAAAAGEKVCHRGGQGDRGGVSEENGRERFKQASR